MSNNRKEVEMHGCLVCARVFNVLVIYSPDNRRMDCSVESSDAHCLKDMKQVLVACNSHTVDEIDAALKRWHSRKDEELDED